RRGARSTSSESAQRKERAMSFTRPRGLNHVAYLTRDTATTGQFYTAVLGMRLVGHALGDRGGSAGEVRRFLRTCFALADASCVAVRGPVDHEGIWQSIYFFDRNASRLELTFQRRPLDDDDARAAADAVAAWTAGTSA